MQQTTSSQPGAEGATLVLFDIDGTLLHGMPPTHRNALCAAADEVFGITLTASDLGLTGGMTDTAILRRALLAAGLPAEQITRGLPACLAASASAYERLVPTDLRRYHTPHAAATLAWLRERGITLGLVTGNVARIAATKLAAAELADYFPTMPTPQHPPAQGANHTTAPPLLYSADSGGTTNRLRWGGYGDEAEAREALPPLALARAQLAAGQTFASHRVYVVGDTPADIACGAAHGLRTVAVATGLTSLADLRACRPDYSLEDLRGLPGLHGEWA